MESTITRRLIDSYDERMMFLPNKLGDTCFMQFEVAVYDTLRQLVTNDLRGGTGYWDFFELSNGGWYMAPTDDVQYEFSCENYYTGTHSGDAAGIIATLYAMNGALHHAPLAVKQAKHLTNAYYALKDYACQHTEAAGILGALD